jgi:hypothetical protein
VDRKHIGTAYIGLNNRELAAGRGTFVNDEETGYVKILRWFLVEDAGTIINPLLADATCTALSPRGSAARCTSASPTAATAS